MLLDVQNVHKTYRLGRVPVPVLRGVSMRVREGEFVAVLGASGSGKSTLLHLLGGLDRPDPTPPGVVRFRGRDIGGASSGALDEYRARDVGFVFQFYHLLPELSVLANVLMGAQVRFSIGGYLARRRALREQATRLLDQVGLSHRLRHRPAELSGGERQRVAIARALINEPALLLADEPTGNLDAKTGGHIIDVLLALRQARALTLVVVTHDESLARRAERVVRLTDGRVDGSPETASEHSPDSLSNAGRQPGK
ncbi:MAG: ABC transporter ATP-binding protein [Planctomycetota bacterium]|nr:ABC transporter ATP-binding protein [Planctomycetota bacterium]